MSMTKIISSVMFFTCVSVSAFNPLLYPSVKPKLNFRYVGDISPTGYFDPLHISENADDDMIKYMREAELHHGRVAMLSMVVMPVCDLVDDKTLAINKLSSLSIEEQLPYWIGFGAYECARMGAGWKNPFKEKNSVFTLEDHYQPGNVFKLEDGDYNEEKMNKELSNGRLAMIGALGYIGQEFVTQAAVF